MALYTHDDGLHLITEDDYLHNIDVAADGIPRAKGLIPRDYSKYPSGYLTCAPAMRSVVMDLIDQAEFDGRIQEMTTNQSRLSDVRRSGNNGSIIEALDQNGKGYCWAHSSTHAAMMVRAIMNEPYVPLSAYAIACIIKNYADEGGWGALSLQFINDRGVPSQAKWPQQSMSNSHDNAETWKNAALHKMTFGWVDTEAAEYDRALSWAQVCTLLLCRCPVVGDFNWWSHSICLLDLVNGKQERNKTRSGHSGKLLQLPDFERAWGFNTLAAGYGVNILNSWGMSWGKQGEGVLTGKKAIPDGAVAPLVMLASAA